MRGWIALIGAATAASATAQDRPSVPPPPIRTVVIPAMPVLEKLPFAPPSGSVVRYRITRAPVGPGAPPPSVVEQELRFDTRPDQTFLLTITTLQVEQDGKVYRPDGALHELTFATDVAALLAPLRLVLDRKGAIQRVEGFEDYRSALLLMPDLAIRAARTDPERQRAVRRRDELVALFTGMTAERAARPAAGIWTQVFGYGDLEFRPGRPRDWSTKRDVFDGAGSVTYRTSLVITQLPTGGHLLERNRVEDPDRIAEASDAAYASGTEQGLAEARALRANALWVSDITRIENAKIVTDLRGLPESVTLEEFGEGEREKRGRMTTTIELLGERSTT